MNRLDYICFTNLTTGYASAAQNYIRALHESGRYDLKVTPLDMNLNSIPDPGIRKLLRPLIAKPKDSNRIRFYHCIPDMQRRFRDPCIRSVGIVVFEASEPPRHWVEILNKNDAVLTASKFNADSFVAAGLKRPIVQIPHCIDFRLFNPDIEPMFKYEHFTFLFVGSWRLRKGYKELLQAWVQTFASSEPVQLVIKTDKLKVAEADVLKVLRKYSCAQIQIEDKKFSESGMAAFIRSADCLISPTRGEGFGLPPLQAMAVGVPVIITNYSGCREYAHPDTAYLLEPEGMVYEKCLDGIPQFSRKQWPVIPIEAIAKQMRYVYGHVNETKKKILAAILYVRQRFTYNAVANLFDALVNELS